MPFDIVEFLFNTPLYEKVFITEEEVDAENGDFDFLFYPNPTYGLDGFNPIRNTNTRFSIIQPLSAGNNIAEAGGIGTFKLYCKQYNDVFYYFIKWDSENRILTKIGQSPSLADFHVRDIKQYNKLLQKEQLKEFTKAIGLAAHGVGIGSFVYLRRIFEQLIWEALEEAIKKGTYTQDDFKGKKIDEKIKMLADYLPAFLVENSSIYSILSKGIHELDENTCLKYFGTVKVGIELILDEKLDTIRKQAKIEEAKKKISEATKDLSTKR